jgi:hypothetical protein
VAAKEKMELNKLRLHTLGDLFALRTLFIKSNPEQTKFSRLVKLLLSYLTNLPTDYSHSQPGKGLVDEFASAGFACLQSYAGCFDKLSDLNRYLEIWMS